MESSIPTEPDPSAVIWMKRGLVTFVGFAVVLGLYVGYWTLMARQLERQLDAWVEARRAEGIDISFGSQLVQGFPGRLHLKLKDISVVSGGNARRIWRWQLPRAEAWAQPWKLRHITYAAHGMQSLGIGEVPDVSGGPGGPGGQEFLIATERVEGRVVVQGAGDAEMKLMIAGLDVDRSKGRLGGARRFDMDVSWRARPKPGEKQYRPLTFDLGIDDADLPKVWASPLGQRVSTMRLVGHVVGPWPGGALTQALTKWRNAGGTLEVSPFSIEHGPLKLHAEGTAALDVRLQPQAAFTVRAEGYLDTVEALVKAGLMRPSEGTAAKLVLTVIAKRPAGRTAFVETPLTLQDQVLSAGEMRLLRLAPIQWEKLRGITLPGGAESAKVTP
jgi:hypothetical protein